MKIMLSYDGFLKSYVIFHITYGKTCHRAYTNWIIFCFTMAPNLDFVEMLIKGSLNRQFQLFYFDSLFLLQLCLKFDKKKFKHTKTGKILYLSWFEFFWFHFFFTVSQESNERMRENVSFLQPLQSYFDSNWIENGQDIGSNFFFEISSLSQESWERMKNVCLFY